MAQMVADVLVGVLEQSILREAWHLPAPSADRSRESVHATCP